MIPELTHRTPSSTGRYVYGLRITGLDGVAELPAADEAWLADRAGHPGCAAGPDGCVGCAAGRDVHVRQDDDTPLPPTVPLGPDRGVRRLADGRTLVVDRMAGTATFHGPPLSPDVLAHPYLAPVATAFNRWAGREVFHAGAFLLGGRAWVVPGARAAGKSSLLASLAARDVPVVSDDIVVLDGETVHTGPRCVDLRNPLPGVPLETRPVRGGTRLRLMLPPLPDRLPLGGWLFPRWGPSVRLIPVGPTELLARLVVHRSWHHLPSDPAALLAIAAVPAWDLVRPPDWAALDETHRVIESTTAGAHPVAVR